MKINRQWYEDKVRACWIGKNIGGTMGGPYEGKPEMQNISGYITEKGQPLPNDDLDLQLVWLKLIEAKGIKSITPALLAEYWLMCIVPHWNEYGTGKANLKIGLLPPYSGEFENEKWRDSNGAWIRTEIWACLFPGFPKMAVRYAYKDACIDHGLGEGTYAAMFVAALESAAFLENDLRKLLEIGLSFIPENCLLAETVRLAVDCYDRGIAFVDARNAVVDKTKSIGMFQAPANVAFVVLGLLYGEGDFKKSMIHTINCGDDTDCTGATVGSIMAIMNGMKAIPEDWRDHIGDSIISNTIAENVIGRYPASCSELTQRIVTLLPVVLGTFCVPVTYTADETEYKEKPICTDQLSIPTNPYTYDEIADLVHTKVRVEFDKRPILAPMESIKLTVTFLNTMSAPRTLSLRLLLPDGWQAEYKRHCYVPHATTGIPLSEIHWSAQITAGENPEMINRIYLEVIAEGQPVAGMIPIVIMG
ncbi:MAG: ADP-ribosylglycohydrolase family protein [Ruminococcaceae bacterium]|nr:ADP-ribosylglycohydrolase family protein [Oscillospiraceae bacterium]